MKYNLRWRRLFVTISSFLILGSAAGCSQPAVTGPDSQTQEGNGVKSHGALRVDGASLYDENGNPVVLRGMSSHGISWYPRYLNVTFKSARSPEQHSSVLTGISIERNRSTVFFHNFSYHSILSSGLQTTIISCFSN